MTRQDANLKIINKLVDYIYDNPEVRFHQMLFNLNINEFSDETKENIRNVEFNGKTTFKDKYNQESLITLSKL